MLNTAKCWFNQQLKQQLFLLEIKKSSQMSHLRQKSLGFECKKDLGVKDQNRNLNVSFMT